MHILGYVFLQVLHGMWSTGHKVIRSAIQAAGDHSPLGTPTGEGLCQMFCDPQMSMAARRIFKLCFECTAALEPELPGWPLLMEIVALLGTFVRITPA